MTLFKSLLLGSAVGFVAVASAQAADLPSKKAAPATYVKICDAYGAGFFFIPGTETCVKLGGRVRYDIGYAPKGKYYSKDGALDQSIQDTYGQHVRGRIDVETRTGTAYGVARTVTQLRMGQTTGVLNSKQSPNGVTALDYADVVKYDPYSPSIERAFIQFAGFTVGRASSTFANGPSLSFGSNSHFTSYANGTLQASYTAVLGGGFSATIGIEDNQAEGGQNTDPSKFPNHTPYDKMPVLVGNVSYDQSWGRIQVSGAVMTIRSAVDTATAVTWDKSKQGYAYAGFLTYNADMVGKGDKFYLLAGYSSGINAMGFKDASNATSNNARDIDGIAQSYKNWTCNGTQPVAGYSKVDATTGVATATAAVAGVAPTECQNTNSTWVSGAFVHNWTAQLRSNVMAGWASVDPGTIARAAASTTQKATFTSVGTNLIWSPVKDFDIGVEVLYNRASVGETATLGCLKSSGVTPGCSASGNMVFTRIRLERTF